MCSKLSCDPELPELPSRRAPKHQPCTPSTSSSSIAYFAVVFGIGAYFFRRAKTSKSYFLADRSVGWVAVGASLFASNISSEHFIGLAGSGRELGAGGRVVRVARRLHVR